MAASVREEGRERGESPKPSHIHRVPDLNKHKGEEFGGEGQESVVCVGGRWSKVVSGREPSWHRCTAAQHRRGVL